MFLKVGGKAAEKKPRLYLMKFWFEDCLNPVFKIGKSSGDNSVPRIQQITKDHYDKYRYFPQCGIKRDRQVDNAFELEAMLHRAFKHCRYVPSRPFDGSTEMFVIPEDVAVKSFELALEGTNFDDFDPYMPEESLEGLPLGKGFYNKSELQCEIERLTELYNEQDKPAKKDKNK